jgi:hypothetical protein
MAIVRRSLFSCWTGSAVTAYRANVDRQRCGRVRRTGSRPGPFARIPRAMLVTIERDGHLFLGHDAQVRWAIAAFVQSIVPARPRLEHARRLTRRRIGTTEALCSRRGNTVRLAGRSGPSGWQRTLGCSRNRWVTSGCRICCPDGRPSGGGSAASGTGGSGNERTSESAACPPGRRVGVFIPANGAGPFDLGASRHDDVAYPIGGRSVQQRNDQAIPRCRTPTPASNTRARSHGRGGSRSRTAATSPRPVA